VTWEPTPEPGTAAARIDLGALAHNFACLQRRAGGRELFAVVKADAYGHGAAAVARRLQEAGCRSFAVAVVAEAAELRRAGLGAPILLLSGVRTAGEARRALALAATPVLHGEEQRAFVVEAARALGRRAGVHVEIDTGMRRLGVPAGDAVAFLAQVAAAPELVLEGVSTHFARADEADPAPTRAQLDAFGRALADARGQGVDPGRVHVANSAGLLAARGWGAEILGGDAVRPGLALYGVAPAPHLADPELRPVMTLVAEVVSVRAVAAGEGVGYGHDWHAPRSGWLATLPIGYADGMPWSAARRGQVWLAGRCRPIAGRVSMDSTTVWMDGDPVRVGDRAVVFGALADGERLGVEQLAEAAGTMPYEILVRIGARVPRVAVA
jgi:alanine racemase